MMKPFIFCSINDISSMAPDWERILEKLDNRYIVGEDDVWEVAKMSDATPHFGNIYQDLLLSRIQSLAEEQYPGIDIDYYVNALASHLYVNGNSIYCVDDFFNELASWSDDQNDGEE